MADLNRLRARVGLRVALATVLVGVGARAQNTVVVPQAYTGTEASGVTGVPFGRAVSMRAQLAYGAQLFSRPVIVTALGFRLDAGTATASKQVDLSLRMSAMSRGVTGIQAVFDNNPGAGEVQVLDRVVLDLPAVALGGTPAVFALQIPLSRPFQYTPSGDALLVDVRVFGQQRGPYWLDATFMCTSPQQLFGPIGCGPGPQLLEVQVASTQVAWGRPIAVLLRHAPPGSVTVLALGSRETGLLYGRPLPIDLTLLGAPGCHASIDYLWLQTAYADGSGVATHSVFIPSVPGLQQQWLRYQGIALDPVANPLGLVTSQAGKVQVCGWEAVSRVYAPQVTAMVGARELGVAPVLQLTVQ